MKLRGVKLRNFRSYKSETFVSITGLTALIGKNDSGKSSILEALDIFFNSESIKIEQLDASVGGDSSDVRITCIFDELPQVLTIDSSAATSLEDEYLLNREGYLEITKIFNCSLVRPSVSVFANANHPSTLNVDDLHKLKDAELKERIRLLGVGVEGVDRRSNVQKRRAIWNCGCELNLVERLISLDKEGGKEIWDKIKEELPIYALFQSDRASKDDDNEVQDPMKLAIQEAISSMQTELNQIKQIIKSKAEEVATRTLEKLMDMDPELARQLNPSFKSEPKWDTLFKLSLTDDNDIPINKRGSGTRRLILINFFRAEAERRQSQSGDKGVIYAIEEPETGQHPNNQRMLIEAFKELASNTNSQVLITTHVPSLSGLIPTDSLRFIQSASDVSGNKVINVCDLSVLIKIANELGVFPDKRVKVLFCVEGPSDVEFMLHVSKLLHSSDPSIINLETDDRVVVLPQGGGTLKQFIERHYSKRLGLKEVHVYDRDELIPPKYQEDVDLVNLRNDGSWATLTNKREIENYFHPDSIQEVFNISIPVTDNCDLADVIFQAINADGNHPMYPINKKRVKKILSEKVLFKTTLNRLLLRDTDGEIVGWFNQISSRLN